MIRSIFASLAAFTAITAISAQGCKASGVGDPCIPEKEFDPSFLGFDVGEVNVESKSFQCLTRLCLVNHFRGRVTCPYGQDKTGTALPTNDGQSGGPFGGTDSFKQTVEACTIPGGSPTDPNALITGKDSQGNYVDPANQSQVRAQCVDRVSANAVYCSCRCANADGKTDDGANYCTCPDGFQCSQLVAPVGLGDVGLTGAYCIKKDTQYEVFGSCLTPCDPNIPDQNCSPPAIR